MRRAVFLLSLASCSATSGNERIVDAESGSSAATESTSNSGPSDTETTASTSTSDDTSTSTSDDTETETTTEPDTDTADTGEPGGSLGVFELTYYWVAYEGDYPGAPDTAVGDCQGNTLATVPAAFAAALKLEGTGKLLDERILNIGGCGCGGGYDCFAELDVRQFPWGQGSQGNALVPFVTLATDPAVLPFGTWVYAPILDGLVKPDGQTHNGCLRAGDVGGSIDGMHIDWFMGLKDHYEYFDPGVPETIELFEGGTWCP